MYISGQQSDFASRLHQLPLVSGDLSTGFLIEGRTYLASGNVPESGRWEQEARRWNWLLNQYPSGLVIQQF